MPYNNLHNRKFNSRRMIILKLQFKSAQMTWAEFQATLSKVLRAR
jgi:hypothetical protein